MRADQPSQLVLLARMGRHGAGAQGERRSRWQQGRRARGGEGGRQQKLSRLGLSVWSVSCGVLALWLSSERRPCGGPVQERAQGLPQLEPRLPGLGPAREGQGQLRARLQGELESRANIPAGTQAAVLGMWPGLTGCGVVWCMCGGSCSVSASRRGRGTGEPTSPTLWHSRRGER